MKTKITRKVFVELTLDSSEMIMFTKGGKHKVEVPCEDLDATNGDIIEISIQLANESYERFQHTHLQAKIHKESYENFKN